MGGIYGANTVGAILGSVLFSLWFIPGFGTLGSQQLLIAFSAIAGVVVLEGAVANSGWKLAGAVVAAALIAWMIPPIPWMLIGFGRRLPIDDGQVGTAA